jgi:hypothetical protein
LFQPSAGGDHPGVRGNVESAKSLDDRLFFLD